MMLHCLNASGGVSNGAELTVLERQRACIKWQQQQQQGLQYSNMYSVSEAAGVGNQVQAQVCGDLSGVGRVGIPMVKPDIRLDDAWAGFGNYGMPSADDFVSSGYRDDSGTEYIYHMKKTASCPVSAIAENSDGKDSILTGRTSLRGQNSKKRKADIATSLKEVADNDTEEKKIKECADDGESKITHQNRSGNSKIKIKGEASADSSKVSEVQKNDYIHVRARRGQATDSHSLAERVRREKISERMKYLQELVPGCHKITGKAGMLDEIINYVQSLQRQVEFLSMKLATVNPQLNFSMESLFEKEIFQPCASSYPTLGSASEMTNPAYSHSKHLDDVISTEIDLQNYQPDMGLQMQLTETYVDTNSFNQIHQNYSNWNAELQNLFSNEFQARAATYPSQAFTGSFEANQLKMEI